MGFYQSAEWRAARNSFIAENPLCARCGRLGRIVDHIKPIKRGGAQLDSRNLQTMCQACHNRKTFQRRINPKTGLPYLR